jgi:hypothetical protein
MYRQCLEALQVKPEGTYLDGTFGRGGHARGVLQQLGPGGRLLVMDKDPEAIAVAEREFGADPRVAIFRGSFTQLAQWEATAGGLDGVLFDLGSWMSPNVASVSARTARSTCAWIPNPAKARRNGCRTRATRTSPTCCGPTARNA